MSKIIVIDFGMVLHRSAHARGMEVPPTYTAMNSMVSYLKKIGITPNDKVIIACDGKGNWRKAFEKEYKANRAEIRRRSGLDWNKIYKDFDWLLSRLFKSTGWGIVRLNEIEADDIASIVAKYIKKQEVILVSTDSDWELLWHYPNVKIFSPLKKFKGKKGAYKVKPPNFNPHSLLAKKIKKEISDNLTKIVDTEKAYENRKIVVDLINLPKWVENKILNVLRRIKFSPNFNFQSIPFPNSIGKRIKDLYKQDKVISYEECVEYYQNKKEKKNGRKNKRTNKRPVRSRRTHR